MNNFKKELDELVKKAATQQTRIDQWSKDLDTHIQDVKEVGIKIKRLRTRS